ncbi:MAG: hypothetical protein LBD75_03020, partial [Candidatus Peribacteria bacterium]|nr:hypothetical protein [Candidatus Peribacteria bacterium]
DLTLNLPEGTDLNTIDWSKYTVNVVGLSSKTGSRATNIAVSKKRAESAKSSLIAQYSIPDTAFNLTEKWQGDYPERMNDDISSRQGVKVEIKKKEAISENNPDEDLDSALNNL